ncbi:PREDICTED: 2-acylglycerol O-acyltransferase 2-B-like [Atta colombica]|uniref:2-acylglycerol O-acyltransferase 2-B-like n=1 Tax=Atta colombica TaxID=520822 RepID=UPI00084CBBE9|nr:PREDICTED: 2-acylglycerol O-acyltransferase 2-B-like [Atta colombica]
MPNVPCESFADLERNMEILGVKFAPLNVPLERRLQTLIVAIWIFVTAFGDFWGYLITIYLIFYTETIRYFLLLYFLWMYYDWDTCHNGGRSEIWTRMARNNVFWRHFCNYFPLKLVKMVDLDPKKSYLFVSVPHGILSIGIFGSFASDILDCKKLFPGLEFHTITLDQHFKIPLFREYPYSLEFSFCTYLTALVPVFSFGETDLYNQIYSPEGSTLRRIQNYIRNLIGLAPIVFSGRGFFQYSFGLIPKRLPVTVVVGSPIELPKIDEPTTEQINEYHEKFMKSLVELFETQKYNYIKNAENVTLEL